MSAVHWSQWGTFWAHGLINYLGQASVSANAHICSICVKYSILCLNKFDSIKCGYICWRCPVTWTLVAHQRLLSYLNRLLSSGMIGRGPKGLRGPRQQRSRGGILWSLPHWYQGEFKPVPPESQATSPASYIYPLGYSGSCEYLIRKRQSFSRSYS